MPFVTVESLTVADVQPPMNTTMSEEDTGDVVRHEWSNFARLIFLPNSRVTMPRYINFI